MFWAYEATRIPSRSTSVVRARADKDLLSKWILSTHALKTRAVLSGLFQVVVALVPRIHTHVLSRSKPAQGAQSTC